MSRHYFSPAQPKQIFRLVTFTCLLLLAGIYAMRLQSAQELKRPAHSPLLAISSQPLPVARYLHTATLLPNGKVLVVGGASTGAPDSALQSALLYDPFKTDWTEVATPGAARYGHIAVLLRNGKVLVAGGRNGGGLLKSAEIYDPVANSWTPTGAMTANRFRATATLLAYASNAGAAGAANPRNGSALVIGGEGDTGAIETAEFYNSATGVWQLTGAPMKAKRIGHTATQLLSGDVLVAGGYANASQPLTSAEIYDPLADRWKTTGGLRAGRFGHTATLLTTGQVMVVGGLGGNGAALDSSELYSQPDQSWEDAQSKLAKARAFHSATLLPSGALIVIGGFGSATGAGVRMAESYDPTSDNLRQWVAAGDFLNDRGAHTATVMANARVLIVGGAADGGGASPLPSVEIHDPAGGKWSVEKPLSRARVDHTATLLPNGKVLVAGGIDKNGSMKSAELYTSDLSNNVGVWSPTADMNVARQEHRATLLANGKVLVTGGVSGGVILDSAEIYDPITGAWTLINPMPGARVTHTATLLANGKVLITGGRNAFGVIRSCAIYDPATNSWGGTGSLNQPRANHTATLLYDGRVLAAGGSPTTSLATSELYDVAANRWANVASQMLPAGHRNHTATLLPNGKVLLVAGLRGSGNEITDFNGSAHLFDTARLRWDSVTAPTGRLGHTATLLPNGKALIVGGFTIQSAGGGGLTTVIGNSVQFYDPARGVSVPYTTGPSMSAPRDGHTATLLANGKVLVTGGVRRSAVLGQTFIEFLSSVETFDAGLGVDELAATVSPFVTSATWNGPGNPLCAAGIRFQGVSESGGGGPLSSNPNYPVLQLMRIDNEQQYFLSPDPGSTRCATRGWTNNGYGSMTIPATTSLGATNNMQPGPVMLTAFVNGTPNRRSLILGVSGAQNETVNLSGRIHTVADSGLQVAVELRGSDGSMRVERSGPNGEYVFEDVPTRTPNASVGAVTPNRIPAGSQSTQIIVTGSGFRPIGSTIPNQILFNGQPLPTSFDSSTQLRATIPSQFLRSAGFASVTVRILNSDNTTSVTPPLTIEIAGGSETAHPVIKSLNPPSCQVGTPGLQVTINGSNLLNGTTQVLWNGQPRGIISGSNTQLVFAPLPSDLARAGAAKVQVTNAGGLSNEVTFTIADQGPVINSISPPSYTAPTSSVTVVPPLTLTINGSGFQSNSVVRANSSFLTTTFVSGSQLRAQLGSAFLNTQSNVVISVLNPSANTISNLVNFPINQAAASTTGSVLLFPFYSTLGFSTLGSDTTTISLTNTNAQRSVSVVLFFVNSADRAVRLSSQALSPNQTRSFSAAQIFPGSRGYVVAIVYGVAAGGDHSCPANFNFLRGSASISLTTGHSATLDAVAIRALSNTPSICPTSSGAAILNFNGSAYERVPHQVIADNIPSIRDNNNTLLIVNAIGGSLFNGGARGVGSLLGILYDTDLNTYSFSAGSSAPQFISVLSNSFPRITPSFENVISNGERGKLTLFPSSSEGPAVFGAVINRGPALNGGYLLRPLTLKSASLTVPSFAFVDFAPQDEKSAVITAPPNPPATETVVEAAPAAGANQQARMSALPVASPQQQQPTPGAPITYTVTPSGAIPSGEPIQFEPPSRTVTPAGGPISLTPEELAAPLDNDDNDFCGRTSPGLKITGTISALNGTVVQITHRLTNNKAPSCNLPDEVTVDTLLTGDYKAENVGAKVLGLEGVYLIRPNNGGFDFRFNPIDPTNPFRDQPEVIAPPLRGLSSGWDFIATPKTSCPATTTATANGQSNPQLCEGQPINLATPAVANATGYQWTFPDGSTRAEQNPVIPSATLANNGLYRVRVTIAGCPAPVEATVNVTVNEFSINPTSASFPGAGGDGAINVSATVNACAWTATRESGAEWITLGSSGGVGSGPLSYAVAQNTGPQRTATMTIAGRTFTVTQEGAGQAGVEADVSPRPNGDGAMTISDWVMVGRFVSGEITPAMGGEYQRADCAPRGTAGDGRLTISDWVQAGRFAASLDPPVPAGGPAAPAPSFDFAGLAFSTNPLKWINWPDARTLRMRTENGKTGTVFSMVIELDALGEENAVSFSLNFDPMRRRLLSVTLAPDVESATLLINRTEIKDGRLGVALALPSEQKLHAGRHRLVTLNFSSLDGDADFAAFAFGDSPVSRELIDVNADSLPVNSARDDERPLAVVSAANFAEQRLARESIAIAFGANLASATINADSQPLPIRLSEAQVSIIDNQGVEHPAPLFSLSPEQVTFQVPPDAALGLATVVIRNQSGQVSRTAVEIVETAPAIFSSESGPQGWPAATLLRVHSDGRLNYEPVLRPDSMSKRLAPTPIEFGADDERLILVLFGTGLRRHGGQVSARIGSLELPVLFAGAQGGMTGLDQINLDLPRALAGSGEIVLRLMVDGQPTNPLRVVIKD